MSSVAVKHQDPDEPSALLTDVGGQLGAGGAEREHADHLVDGPEPRVDLQPTHLHRLLTVTALAVEVLDDRHLAARSAYLGQSHATADFQNNTH